MNMLRVALFALALVPASAVDSSKVDKPSPKNCFLGMFCWEDEDEFEWRNDANLEAVNKVSEVQKHINEIQAEKDAREKAEKDALEKKLKEREINKKYCGCNFACGADDGSKCFDACCADEQPPLP